MDYMNVHVSVTRDGCCQIDTCLMHTYLPPGPVNKNATGLMYKLGIYVFLFFNFPDVEKYQMEFEMDVVYTYVDGEDPCYRRNYTHQTHGPIDDVRCVDHGELLFSVEMLLQHMNWIRKVFVVHGGHNIKSTTLTALENMIPCSRLCVLPQTDILPEIYANTVSSCTVEAFLHRIPGLSEYFFYLNDDMIIGRPLAKHDWIVHGRVQLDVSVREYPVDYNQAQRHNTNAFQLCRRQFPALSKHGLLFSVSHQAAIMNRRACELAHLHFPQDLHPQFNKPGRTIETINFQLLATLVAGQYELGQLRYYHRRHGWLLVTCDFQAESLAFIQKHMPHLFCVNSVSRANESVYKTFCRRYIEKCRTRQYPAFGVSYVPSSQGRRHDCAKSVYRVFDLPWLPKKAPRPEACLAGHPRSVAGRRRARGGSPLLPVQHTQPTAVDLYPATADGHAAMRTMRSPACNNNNTNPTGRSKGTNTDSSEDPQPKINKITKPHKFTKVATTYRTSGQSGHVRSVSEMHRGQDKALAFCPRRSAW